jgi:hypothetical protein
MSKVVDIIQIKPSFMLVLTLIGFLIFDVIPFVLMVVLPSVVIPLAVLFFSKYKIRRNISAIVYLSLCLIILGLLGNFFWDNFIYKHIYYEWDRLILPFTFVIHESPLTDNTGSWIAKGYTQKSLDFIWLGITLSIYLLSGIISLLINIKNRFSSETVRIVINSVVILSIVSTFFALI